MATDDKYDRQVRLWGRHGQKLLSTSKVLLLGANASGTETLKNLVLPGVGSITIVDGGLVSERDCGTNFFVTEDTIGQSKAHVMTQNLLELNPDVSGDHIQHDVDNFVSTQADLIKNYNLVIATEVNLLSKIAQQCGVSLIIIRQYGLIGYIRNYKKESTVVESKPSDVIVDDLRISNPFHELKEYALSINYDDCDDMIHSHIPYNVILIKTLEDWKSTHEGKLPCNQQEKDEFRSILKGKSRDFSKELNFNEAMDKVFKCFQKPSVRDSVQDIFDDPKIDDVSEKSNYWLLCRALKRFHETHGDLPLTGSLPDMTSTTDFYLTLQRIHLQKAAEDQQQFEEILLQVCNEAQVQPSQIQPEDIKQFCLNCQILEVTKFDSPEQELTAPDFDDLLNELFDDESAAPWYVVIRAVENFRAKNQRHPGQSEDQFEPDFLSLRQEVDSILSKISPDGSAKIDDKYIREIIRFSDSQLHVISAFLGGIASQEAIKLLISQYTPFNHTLIYDGIQQKCQVIKV
ncbi:nedd8-activating enzyme e1 regulatory subunit [Stylonychia lemnae]|uniref:NEDD8-activating enzyme E1 regulatory subunit n=1 Tax=Stylonychia lemnae TaxID=5949 RepID=A0A078ASF4_STYLE|nr:nedd8-activating enzyme e1 regulatory subunit [Stylonychia lemnae]|eukprot:CDW84911.1 nedd8-activating enzyme e1 regulatory subunit [Stylonychia lemnae]